MIGRILFFLLLIWTQPARFTDIIQSQSNLGPCVARDSKIVPASCTMPGSGAASRGLHNTVKYAAIHGEIDEHHHQNDNSQQAALTMTRKKRTKRARATQRSAVVKHLLEIGHGHSSDGLRVRKAKQEQRWYAYRPCSLLSAK
jgi:hypothetical protein